jgi:hypothetical protein
MDRANQATHNRGLENDAAAWKMMNSSSESTCLQDLAVENSAQADELEQVRAALVRESQKVADLTEALGEARKASAAASGASAQLAEAEAVRAELLAEGQRLMEDKQKLEATVKELRKALKATQVKC